MTQLYIDSKEVKLPSEFELELITENPYFTRVGSYTYEIEIDLHDPTNRNIYKNINRADVTQRIKNRKAVIITNGLCAINGIEVILSIDSFTAKIQIIAGNSQLNYEGGENSIRSINFDKFTLDPNTAINTLFGTYPQFNATFTPIISYVDKDGNASTLNLVRVGENITFERVNNIAPQYYLLYYIDNLLQKLGFTKGTNELETDPTWQRIFVANPYKDSAPGELLPDWTINEFIEQIEKFFKCVVSINSITGIYDIINMDKYYENAEIIYLDEVIDNDLEKVYDTDTNYSYAYENVSYNLPSEDYYNYLKLKDGIRDICIIETKESYRDFESNYDQYYSGPYILNSTDYNLNFVVSEFTSDDDTVKGLKMIDRLRDAGDTTSQNKTSFDIIPAEVDTIEVYSEPSARYLLGTAIKKVRSEAESQAINDLINGSGDIEGDIPDKLYVGIYYGICTAWNKGTSSHPEQYWDKMPMSSFDKYFMTKPIGFTNSQSLIILPDYSLVLYGDNGLYNAVYKNKKVIDTTVEYRFRFIANQIYDLNRIFLIGNKKYYCKEIHYNISSKGIDKIAEGIFYLTD
ncbi:MAG: hypothetical protein H9949_10095 [Candidatus Phocaeicola merdigallinarum]|nr:hypothetical protein [Candidatus Phocaeicola merdigallinarum]